MRLNSLPHLQTTRMVAHTPSEMNLLDLINQEELPALLRTAIARVMDSTGAIGSAICFRPSKTLSEQQQMGSLPHDALERIQQWQSALFERPDISFSHHRRFTAHAILKDGSILVEIPLLNTNGLCGSISLLLPANTHLNDQQFHNLHTLSRATSQLATLRLNLKTTDKKLKRLHLLHDIGQSLTSTLELPTLLQKTILLAAQAMNASASTLLLLDPDEPTYLVPEASHGIKQMTKRRVRIPLSEGLAGWVAKYKEAIIINQPGQDHRFDRRLDFRTGFLTRNVIAAPLQVNGELIGVLQVLNKAEITGFNEEDKDLLLTLSSQAAIAIQNARLLQELREEQQRLLMAEEEMRKKLSRNLHDSTLQRLAVMQMSVEHIRTLVTKQPTQLPAELKTLEETITHTMEEARTLLFELRPLLLKTQGLVAALEHYVTQLHKTNSLRGGKVTLELKPNIPRLKSHIEETLFAMLQEAVTNARKHSQAKEITIRGYHNKTHLYLSVEDNGIGFKVAAMKAKYQHTGSLGILHLTERAELINAQWHLSSQIGKGTQVHIRVPLSQ